MVRLDEGGLAAEEVRIFAPRPALRRWVQHVSIQPGPARHGGWRVVPDTSAHVILTVMGDGAARCRIVGARRTYADIDVADRRWTIAVRLQPGALPALTRASAAAFTDRAFDVVDVLGAPGSALIDQPPDFEPLQAARRLLGFVEARCTAAADARVTSALARVVRVDDLQQALGLTARAVHTHMVDTVGLAPKRALRIRRLLSALHHGRDGRSLASAALAARYSDQAHFTREARALLGEPPATWMRRATAHARTSMDSHR